MRRNTLFESYLFLIICRRAHFGPYVSWIRASSSTARILTYAPASSLCSRGASKQGTYPLAFRRQLLWSGTGGKEVHGVTRRPPTTKRCVFLADLAVGLIEANEKNRRKWRLLIQALSAKNLDYLVADVFVVGTLFVVVEALPGRFIEHSLQPTYGIAVTKSNSAGSLTRMWSTIFWCSTGSPEPIRKSATPVLKLCSTGSTIQCGRSASIRSALLSHSPTNAVIFSWTERQPRGSQSSCEAQPRNRCTSPMPPSLLGVAPGIGETPQIPRQVRVSGNTDRVPPRSQFRT